MLHSNNWTNFILSDITSESTITDVKSAISNLTDAKRHQEPETKMGLGGKIMRKLSYVCSSGPFLASKENLSEEQGLTTKGKSKRDRELKKGSANQTSSPSLINKEDDSNENNSEEVFQPKLISKGGKIKKGSSNQLSSPLIPSLLVTKEDDSKEINPEGEALNTKVKPKLDRAHSQRKRVATQVSSKEDDYELMDDINVQKNNEKLRRKSLKSNEKLKTPEVAQSEKSYDLLTRNFSQKGKKIPGNVASSPSDTSIMPNTSPNISRSAELLSTAKRPKGPIRKAPKNAVEFLKLGTATDQSMGIIQLN
jgi:hypothetical protein